MKKTDTFSVFTSLCLWLLIVISDPVYSEALSPSLKVESTTQAQSRKTQQRVDQWSADTERLLAEYQQITQQLDYQESYREELAQKLSDQDAEILRLQQSIAQIQITRLHLLPLLREMVSTLAQFIALDLPFEQAARLAAVDELSQLLANSQIILAEKFRRVMELYQAENDYNYSLATYRGEIKQQDSTAVVEFLRVGRLALYYRSLDGKQLGLWSESEKNWVDVSALAQASEQVQKAIRVAKEQQAPELLALPMVEHVLIQHSLKAVEAQ